MKDRMFSISEAREKLFDNAVSTGTIRNWSQRGVKVGDKRLFLRVQRRGAKFGVTAKAAKLFIQACNLRPTKESVR